MKETFLLMPIKEILHLMPIKSQRKGGGADPPI